MKFPLMMMMMIMVMMMMMMMDEDEYVTYMDVAKCSLAVVHPEYTIILYNTIYYLIVYSSSFKQCPKLPVIASRTGWSLRIPSSWTMIIPNVWGSLL